MTLTEVFDALRGNQVTRIEFEDGSYVVGPKPFLVDLVEGESAAEAWIDASEEGIVLHFNAKRVGPRGVTDMQGQTEPLSSIRSVR